MLLIYMIIDPLLWLKIKKNKFKTVAKKKKKNAPNNLKSREKKLKTQSNPTKWEILW